MLSLFTINSEKLLQVCLLTFIRSLSEKVPVYLFIDFGQLNHCATFDFLVNCANIIGAHKITAVSSGVHASLTNLKHISKTDTVEFANRSGLNTSSQKGSRANKPLKYEKIRHLSGTNTLLLSVLNEFVYLYRYGSCTSELFFRNKFRNCV